MVGAFDPYHRWLGIPAQDQPADHYRLLGLVRYESDSDVIENAANQRMAHLRSFQTGRHAAESQKLLNEVAAARICLLHPEKKAAYDETLRQAEMPPVSVAAPPRPAAPSPWASPRIPPPPLPGQPGAEPDAMAPPVAPNVATHPVSRLRRRNPKGVLVALVGCLGALGIVIAIVLATRGNRPAGSKVVLDLAGTDREEVAFSIDGVDQPLPSSGPLEFACQSGPHEVIATRRGYPPYRRQVTLGTQQSLTIVPGWSELAEPAPSPGTEPNGRPEDAESADGGKTEKPDLPEPGAVAGQDPDSVSPTPSATDPSAVEPEPAPEDALVQKAAGLVGEAKNASGAIGVGTLVAKAEKFFDEAAAANRNDLALQVLDAFQEQLSQKPWQPYAEPIAQRQALHHALAELETDPNDPEANAVAGRWYLVESKDPQRAFSHMAKIQHEALRSLAEAELTPPHLPAEQAALGDRWWDQAKSATDSVLKEAFVARAVYWYRVAQPRLGSRAEADRIASRLNDPLRAVSIPQTPGRPWPLPEGKEVQKDGWLDLGPQISLFRDVVRGQWQPSPAGLASAEHGDALMLPVAVHGDYELTLRGSPSQGAAYVMVTVPVGRRATCVCFPGPEAIKDIDGRGYVPPRRRSISSSSAPFALLIRVTSEGDRKRISAEANGSPYFEWEGEESSLACCDLGQMPRRDQPGLVSWRGQVVISEVRFRLLEGEARILTGSALPAPPCHLTGEMGYYQGTAFEQFAPEGAVLAGLRYTSDSLGLGNLQPVYRTKSGDLQDGTWVAGEVAPTGSVLAKDGYAVGGLEFDTERRRLRGVTVRFCAMGPDGLLAADSYEGPRIGDAGTDSVSAVETRGRPAIGIHGLWNSGRVVSLGLIMDQVPEDQLWRPNTDGRGQHLSLLDLDPLQGTVAGVPDFLGLGVGTADPARWPILDEDSQFCSEFIYAPAPSIFRWKRLPAMKSFTAIGYCAESRSVRFRVRVDGQTVFESQAAGVVPIKVDLPPGEQLELYVDPMGSNQNDESFWMFPRMNSRPADRVTDFDGRDPRSKRLADLTPVMKTTAPRSKSHKPLLPVFPAEGLCPEFLYAHPPSRLVYRVPKGATRFSAEGYAVTDRDVRFRVSINGKEVFQSNQLGIEAIQVSLPRQASTIELWTEPSTRSRVSSDDTAFWCFPRFTK